MKTPNAIIVDWVKYDEQQVTVIGDLLNSVGLMHYIELGIPIYFIDGDRIVNVIEP